MKAMVVDDEKNVELLMITACSNQYYKAAMENGADNYYTKPPDLTMLKRKLLQSQDTD